MGLFAPGTAQANPDDTTFSQTEARSATTPYSGVGANANDVTKDADRVTTSNPASANQGSFLNAAVPGLALTTPGGLYRTMTNYWNTDVSWSCPALVAKFGAGSPAVANCSTGNGTAADVDLTTKTLTEKLDSTSSTPEFSITGLTGPSYFPAGRTGVPNAIGAGATGTCQNAPQTNACHWAPNNFHFPTSYPASYKGCNFGQCSNQLTNTSNAVVASAGFPTPVASLVSMQSNWNYTLPAGTVPNSGVFDVAYDIWLDTNAAGTLPGTARNLNQNDGAEIMIWASNHGYQPVDNNTLDSTHLITPAGRKVESQITIPGAPANSTWDVWINRQNTDVTGGTQWNIVTFVANPSLPSFSADTRVFLDKAMTYNAGDRPDIMAQLAGDSRPSVKAACPVPAVPTVGVPAQTACALPSWWLTSVQAGFEIWRAPTAGAITSNSLTVNPLTILGDPAFAAQNTGITGTTLHSNGDGTTKPILHWDDHSRLSYSGCAVATTTTATATISYGNNAVPPQQVTLTQQAGTGIWDGPILPSDPGHEASTITFTLPCGDASPANGFPIFVDPSGHVTNQDGLNINGATVTLGLCTNGAASTAPCPAVAANSPLITPNRNPETTADPGTGDSGPGAFRWDVSGNNFWTVTASAPGCTTKTIGPLQVPPPRVDLNLQLTCTTSAPNIIEVGGAVRPPANTGTTLPTTVVVRPPGVGQFGYCADVFVTNNTNAPVTWNTSFTVPGNQIINQMWNMVLTQGGNPNVATNVHADPNNPWNKILNPGQTTQSVGFCAVPR